MPAGGATVSGAYTLEQVEAVCAGLVGEEDREVNGRFVKTAVVVQLADCLPYCVSLDPSSMTSPLPTPSRRLPGR